jgi:hypothetical protein
MDDIVVVISNRERLSKPERIHEEPKRPRRVVVVEDVSIR